VAGKKERQRRLARQHYERQQARRAHHSRRWRTWAIIGLVCITVVGTGTGVYFLLQGGGKSASAASASARPTPTASGTGSAAAAAAEPATHCTYPASPPAARKVGVPPATPVVLLASCRHNCWSAKLRESYLDVAGCDGSVIGSSRC
jgi:peptidyl-prolyl cis-trans isomerase B (cyclophilin B)